MRGGRGFLSLSSPLFPILQRKEEKKRENEEVRTESGTATHDSDISPFSFGGISRRSPLDSDESNGFLRKSFFLSLWEVVSVVIAAFLKQQPLWRSFYVSSMPENLSHALEHSVSQGAADFLFE